MAIQLSLSVVGVLLVSGFMSFIFNTGHLLNSLLSLEWMAVSVYGFLSLGGAELGLEFMPMFYMVLIVCEGVLGLSLLVVIIMSYSSDYLKTVNLVLC
nr:NADH dehydrogenase subunit 4L [Eusirus cf. giganteus clade g1]UIN24713.1 NADH dehydrogenase subunit 4L [Eusirus cf. giganteus clade g2]